MMTGLLAKLSGWLVSPLLQTNDLSMKSFNFIKPLTQPAVNSVKSLFEVFPTSWGGVALVIFGIVTVIASITVMGKLMKTLMVGKARTVLNNAIGRGPLHGITSGMLVTILVQSSSTTTSLVVPLVGSNVLSVRQVYPFTLGANIGTCITALLAATAVVGGNAAFALQIALVHLLFNCISILFIFGIPVFARTTVEMCRYLGRLCGKKQVGRGGLSQHDLCCVAWIGIVYLITILMGSVAVYSEREKPLIVIRGFLIDAILS